MSSSTPKKHKSSGNNPYPTPVQSPPGTSKKSSKSKSSKSSASGRGKTRGEGELGFGMWLFKWTAIISLLGTLWSGFKFLDQLLPSFYQFDPQALHSLARRAIETHSPSSLTSPSSANLNTTTLIVDHIIDELEKQYPSWTINHNRKEWVMNNAGGAMGAMYVVHASVTEYLIIFGSAVGTEGHTGRHLATDYFNILQGEQWAYVPGAFEKEVYPAGSVHILPRGEAKQYKFHEGGFALELAQGWIPSMMLFGLFDVFSSTLDYVELWDTFRVSGREMIKNLINGKF